MKLSRIACALFPLVFAGIFTQGCATSKPPRLVIIGGAFSQSNAPLYRHILDAGGTDATMTILPTASGVPESSGPLTKMDFDQFVTDETVRVNDLRYTQPEKASDPLVIEDINSSDIVFFTGGYQSRILDVFRPGDEATSPAYMALKSKLNEGMVISGTSAGAAMMSDPMIEWGYSPEALLVGIHDVPDRAVKVVPGMGFFPYGLTDQHFIERARFGRLIAAQEAIDSNFGFGIEENRAIDVNLETDSITGFGDQALFFVDRRHSTRDGLKRENIRISLLGDGDVVNGKTGIVKLSEDRIDVPQSIQVAKEFDLPENVWERGEFADFFSAWILADDLTATTTGDEFDLLWTKDDQTIIKATYDDPHGSVSAVNIRLDILPKATAEEAAKKLLAELNAEAEMAAEQ